MFSETAITRAYQAHPQAVELAFTETFRGMPDAILNADALRAAIAQRGGASAAGGTILALFAFHPFYPQLARFKMLLQARLPPDFAPENTDALLASPFLNTLADDPIGPVTCDDLDLVGLAPFAQTAGAVRCRIYSGPRFLGSGALISPRLILTAAHVVSEPVDTLDQIPDLGQIKLRVAMSDGQSYPVRVVWLSPCLALEQTGALPDTANAKHACDAALLRLYDPLGRDYGHLNLEPADAPAGVEPLLLIHYPNGNNHGLSVGKILRHGPGDIRQIHSIQTDKGSSGGAGFDRHYKFLGLHQGRWGNVRRLVPYAQFASNADFLAQIANDTPPERLWSLTDTVNGHLIIGRDRLFRILTAVLEKTRPGLKGVWIKRTSSEIEAGLGFSFEIITRYLDLRGHAHEAHRLQIQDFGDVIEMIYAQVLGESEVAGARAGVRDDETTDTAHQDERSKRLVERLHDRARDRGQTLWLYFEHSPDELTPQQRQQLEQVIREMTLRDGLYVVLSGFETTVIDVDLREEVDAVASGQPALVAEYLGAFELKDVEAVIQAMGQTYCTSWARADIEAFARQAIDASGLQPQFGRYNAAGLKPLADRIRTQFNYLAERTTGTGGGP